MAFLTILPSSRLVREFLEWNCKSSFHNCNVCKVHIANLRGTCGFTIKFQQKLKVSHESHTRGWGLCLYNSYLNNLHKFTPPEPLHACFIHFLDQNINSGSFINIASQVHLQERLVVLESRQVLSFIHLLGEKGERKWSEPPDAQWVFLHSLKQNFYKQYYL